MLSVNKDHGLIGYEIVILQEATVEVTSFGPDRNINSQTEGTSRYRRRPSIMDD